MTCYRCHHARHIICSGMHYTSIQITVQSGENAKVPAIDAREKLLLVEINVSSPSTPWPKCPYVIN